MVWRVAARAGAARQGRPGRVWRGAVRQGEVLFLKVKMKAKAGIFRRGEARCGLASPGLVWRVRAGHGKAWQGMDGHGVARFIVIRKFREYGKEEII